MRFTNRQQAGRMLAERLAKYKGTPSVVCALPRGGVVIGVEIARYLHIQMDLIIPRKIGHPSWHEYAICAVTEDGYLVCDRDEIEHLDPEWLQRAIQEEQVEARRRRLLYLTNRQPVSLEDKAVIIADDGIATGLTMLAAIKAVKNRKPTEIVLAVPVIPKEVALQLKGLVTEIVALETPSQYLGSVGAYYDEFEQVEDEEVIQLLKSLEMGTKAKEV